MPRVSADEPQALLRKVGTMIDWDSEAWGNHVTESEWGTWLPEKTRSENR